MKKSIRLQVIMAGEYDISAGKKVDFSYDKENQIYIASCEKLEFGVVERILQGAKKDLKRMGLKFSGISLIVRVKEREMEVKVFRKGKMKQNEKYLFSRAKSQLKKEIGICKSYAASFIKKISTLSKPNKREKL